MGAEHQARDVDVQVPTGWNRTHGGDWIVRKELRAKVPLDPVAPDGK